MPNWNPIQYEKFLRDRTQPAVDLANRLTALSPRSILDIGCGTGNSTQVLQDKFPNARIVGADYSDEMLAQAREKHPQITFIRADASGNLHEISESYDLVFSNACIQWLPNHRALLPKLMTLLNPYGTLAVQIPMQREHPVHQLLNQLVRTEKWANRLTPRVYNNLTTAAYFDVLSELSDDFTLWETTYIHRMPDVDSLIEWYKGTGLRPYLEQLEEDAKGDFLRDVAAELAKQYPKQENGEILFRYPRLFFMVTKK